MTTDPKTLQLAREEGLRWQMKCPFCGEPYLKYSIPHRYGCGRPIDLKDRDLNRVQLGCLKIERETTKLL